MSETTEPSAEAMTPVAPVVVAPKPNRLYQAAAWVAIVAGTLFIVGAVFCTGFVLGRHSDGSGYPGYHRHGWSGMMMRPGGSMGQMGPMMHPGDSDENQTSGGQHQGTPGGPGPSAPGQGPGGPGQSPQTATPTR
jgi:hypothetical protein